MSTFSCPAMYEWREGDQVSEGAYIEAYIE